MTRLALAVVLGLMLGGSVRADELPSILPGSRVRVSSSTLASGSAIGSFVGVESESVVLGNAAGGSPFRVPLNTISKLEVSVGRRSQAGRGAMIGAAIGVTPGLLLTFGDYSSDVHGDGPSVAAVAAMGAAGGALLGAAIGWALKVDRWQVVEGPVAGVAVVPLRGGAAVSVRLDWGADRANGR